jgi:chromosome partitioning protein
MGARVIAIANCKGGTGKTTTAVNLAAELACLDRRVLLVDLDSQGHSGLGFGVRAECEAQTAHEVFRRSGLDVASAVRPSGVPGVDVLPADRNFTIHAAANEPQRLAEAIAPLARSYDVVLIDTPPAADLPLIAALAAAHCVLVPTQLSHLAHDGLVQFARLFFRVATSLNPDLSAFAIVPIQIDMRTHLQQTILARLLIDFGTQRIFRGIRTDVALAEAFGGGRPVRYHRPGARGAIDYGLLAEHVRRSWLA